MDNYRKCKLWEKSRILLLSVYRIADGFPKNEGAKIGICMKNCCVTNLSNVMKMFNFRKEDSIEDRTRLSILVIDRLKKYLESARDLKIIKGSDFENLIHETKEIRCLLSCFKNTSINN